MSISLNSRHKAGLFLTAVVAGLCLVLGSTSRETTGATVIGLALTWAFGSTNRALHYAIGGLGVLAFIAPLVAAVIDHHHAVQVYDQSLESFRSKLPQFAKEHPDFSAGPVALSTVGAMPATPQASSSNSATAATVPDPYAAYGGTTEGSNASTSEAAHDLYACIARPATPPPPGYASMRIINVPNLGNISFACSMSDKDIARAIRAYPGNDHAPSWYVEALEAGVYPGDIDQITPPLDKPDPLNVERVLSEGAFIEVPSAILALLFFGSLIAEEERFYRRFSRRAGP